MAFAFIRCEYTINCIHTGKMREGGSANFLILTTTQNEQQVSFPKDLCLHLRSVHLPLQLVHIADLRMPKQHSKLPTCE